MTTKNSSPSISELSFEQALSGLEAIVSKLERGEAGLDEAMDFYTRGQQLKDHCNAKLSSARLKVEQINLKDGQPTGVSDFSAQ